MLTQQWAALNPVAPLAWHANIYNAAVGHSLQMLQHDAQSHQLPWEASLGPRITSAGYTWNALAENVFAFATSMFQDHAAFVIDWGPGPAGIQNPPGHRNNIMSSTYREVGIGVLGLGGVSVALTGAGIFNLTTTTSGSYQGQVPTGIYTATFSGMNRYLSGQDRERV